MPLALLNQYLQVIQQSKARSDGAASTSQVFVGVFSGLLGPLGFGGPFEFRLFEVWGGH